MSDLFYDPPPRPVDEPFTLPENAIAFTKAIAKARKLAREGNHAEADEVMAPFRSEGGE